MGKTNQNFTMFKGEPYVQDFLHVGPFWQSQRQAISVQETDEIEFVFYEFENPTNVLFTKARNVGDISVLTSGYYEDDDIIRVQMESSDTVGLSIGEYSFQLKIYYNGASDANVVASGIVKLKDTA